MFLLAHNSKITSIIEIIYFLKIIYYCNIIEIFDIEKSQIIQVLYGHDTWISSVYLSSFQVNECKQKQNDCFYILKIFKFLIQKQKDTLMISLGNDGKLCFWKFDPNSNDNQNQKFRSISIKKSYNFY
ncbi:wd repeat-containing protein [Anaeramoeba ignava]|uniref:Wd repeat-containing protein n=1 Tax=Anaeramoeba ignava TaxID=1746090 RepID=A0A9Q0LQ26_ANAIG|nr:wd repeat-containing protein [Anaeramoeba ignava]